MAGRAERAAWMKAQDLIDRGRECGKIDLADFGQIARSGFPTTARRYSRPGRC